MPTSNGTDCVILLTLECARDTKSYGPETEEGQASTRLTPVQPALTSSNEGPLAPACRPKMRLRGLVAHRAVGPHRQ